MKDIIASLFIIGGSLFCLVAAVGIIRLPDLLIRMHAATKAGTLGAGLILASVAVHFSDIGTTLKAVLTLVFLFLTAPVGAHLIARAAYRAGIDLAPRTWLNHLEDDIAAGKVINKNDGERSIRYGEKNSDRR